MSFSLYFCRQAEDFYNFYDQLIIQLATVIALNTQVINIIGPSSMIKILLTTSLLIVLTVSYSLSGTWQLKNMNGQQVSNPIAFDIYESVTTDDKIKYYLQFSQCHHVLYQVSVAENVMKVQQSEEGKEKAQLQTKIQTSCSEQEKDLEAKIAQTLKFVFFFTIKNDLLVFIHPQGKQLLEFTRIKKIYLTSVVGKWQLDNVFWEQASHSIVEIRDNKTAVFCEGKIEASYQTNYINQITFTIENDNDCQQKNLTKALNHVKYYRIKDGQLELFDEYSVEIIELFFVQGVTSMIKEEEKLITTKEDEQKYTQQGGIVIVDYTSNKEQVTSQLQPYLRNEEQKDTAVKSDAKEVKESGNQ